MMYRRQTMDVRQQQFKRKFGRRQCPFCLAERDPDYKRADELGGYLTDRGKIIGRGRSGVCARHQRRLAKAVKRARYLALLPFSQQV